MLKFNKMNNKSAEAVALRKEGTCKYLMKLEEEWENYELAKEFFSFTDFETGEKPGITMTSMLFCKHGGFIYPITSGQVVTDNVIAEEVDEKQSLAEPDPSNPQAVKEYMWNFFRDAGFSEYAVAGILGNVYAETEFDPRKVNSSGYYGLFQCGGGREKELFERGREYAEKMNLPEDEGWKKAHIQCEYALDEYYKRTKENSGWVNNRLKLEDGSMIVGTKENFENAQSASEAALIWALSFERCIVAETKQKAEDGQVFYTEIQHKDKRLDKADEIYEEFAGTN